MEKTHGRRAERLTPGSYSEQPRPLPELRPWARILAGAGKADSQAACFGGYDGALGQVGTVKLEHLEYHLGLLQRRKRDESENAGVGQLADNGKLAEVLVKSHEDTALDVGAGQDLLVAWVDLPVTRPSHVVAGSPQAFNGATPHA